MNILILGGNRVEKIKVGVIFGGKSAEHEVSLQSAKNIIDALDKEKFTPVLVGIDKKGQWYLHETSNYLLNSEDPKLIKLNDSNNPIAVVPSSNQSSVIHALTAENLEGIDVFFPIVHGTLGEDGSLQGMLRLTDKPFVGPNVLSSAICMDKDIAKKLMGLAGINVAKGKVFTKQQRQDINFVEIERELGLPIFIKPANQGSSVGVSKVENELEFDTAINDAFQYDHKIVVEECINGREIECSVLGNENPRASLPGEVLTNTAFYSYESKYIDEKGADLAIPADLTESEIKLVQETAIIAFQTLQCEGLARVDFFLTDEGRLYVNEINTLPGFTKISMYPKLWEVSGLKYTELITQLIEHAMERHERDNKLKSSVWE